MLRRSIDQSDTFLPAGFSDSDKQGKHKKYKEKVRKHKNSFFLYILTNIIQNTLIPHLLHRFLLKKFNFATSMPFALRTNITLTLETNLGEHRS